MKARCRLLFLIFVVGVLLPAGCSTDDAEPAPDTISYKVVNNSIGQPTVQIHYTDESGSGSDLFDPSLPWELSFNPEFDKPEVLELDATCDCNMTAQILVNGMIVAEETGSMIEMDHTYQ